MNEILAKILAVFQDFKPSTEVCGSALRYAALIVFSSVLLRIFEERLTARIQMRPPRKAFAFFAEPVKAFFKEPFVPSNAQKAAYLSAPVFALATAVFFCFFLSVGSDFETSFGALYLLFAAPFCVYAFVLGAWGGGSRFAFFGAVRMIAQALPAQLILSFIVCSVLVSAGSADVSEIMKAQKKMWFIVPHFPLFLLYLPCAAAAVVQTPFNSPKAARGLASGVYAEYGGMPYWMLKTAESVLLLLLSAFGAILFLGGAESVWAWVLKTGAIVLVLTVMKVSLSDVKTGLLMRAGFNAVLPFVVAWLFATAAVVSMLQGGAG